MKTWDLENAVTALEAALLEYTLKAETVREFAVDGEDRAGVASDLAVWRAAGVIDE